MGNRLAGRIATGSAHRSPALRILNAVHGVEPPAAYARVSELLGMFPLPPGEGTLKAPGSVVRPRFRLRSRLIPCDTPEPVLRRRCETGSSRVSLDARCRHPANPREQTMTVCGYARVSRGRDDGTDTLQNQRLALHRRWRRRRAYAPGHHHGDCDIETRTERPAGGCPGRRCSGGDCAGPAGTRDAGSSWS